jgi:hypothetical protein
VVPPTCEALGAQEAKSLADKLLAEGAYQQAGACYELAGDAAHANLAFLQAVGPESQQTGRALKQQRDQAKALFVNVERAFHKSH